MRSFSGFVSMKRNSDGSESPYEINISLLDACKGTVNGIDQWQAARLLCSQTIMLGLKGIPALYIHSLLGTPNDQAGVANTGRTRSINRHSWQCAEIEALLATPGTPNRAIFDELRRLLAIRREQPAFDPDAAQEVLALGDAFFAFWRISCDERQALIAVANLTDQAQDLSLVELVTRYPDRQWLDLLAEGTTPADLSHHRLRPYQVLWLSGKPTEG